MKKRSKPANAIMGQHSLDEDWCHFCGLRVTPSADVWYSENAEHDEKITQMHGKYVRICASCADRIARIARGEEKDERLHRSG